MSDTYSDHCDICSREMEWNRLEGQVFACAGCGTTTSEQSLMDD